MILYEDTALVVLDKPAGLSSEDGVPAALRKLWGRPDAYVGVIHRLDTGVSGRAAQKVAEKMARISRTKQVLCVTHLPQIAAAGDHHFKVYKEDDQVGTISRIRRLTDEERVVEIAGMISGSVVSDAALENARLLLGQF